jgi:hypothetical protein
VARDDDIAGIQGLDMVDDVPAHDNTLSREHRLTATGAARHL